MTKQEVTSQNVISSLRTINQNKCYLVKKTEREREQASDINGKETMATSRVLEFYSGIGGMVAL